MDLRALGREVEEWERRNFGPPSYMGYASLLGVIEEVGELAHHHLKQLDGIRGTPEEHQAGAADAIGDIVIFLLSYCIVRGFDLETIIESTWARVKARDWTKDKQTGGAGDLSLAQCRRRAG